MCRSGGVQRGRFPSPCPAAGWQHTSHSLNRTLRCETPRVTRRRGGDGRADVDDRSAVRRPVSPVGRPSRRAALARVALFRDLFVPVSRTDRSIRHLHGNVRSTLEVANAETAMENDDGPGHGDWAAGRRRGGCFGRRGVPLPRGGGWGAARTGSGRRGDYPTGGYVVHPGQQSGGGARQPERLECGWSR